MKKTMSQYIREDSELRERFVVHAHRENSNIKDFGDFSSALFSAFDTEKGKKASKWFNEDELIELFVSPENEREITRNISQKEYNDMVKSIRNTEVEVNRKVPVGKVIKPRQVKSLLVPKKSKVIPHSRSGKTIKTYNRGFKTWTPAEAKFLGVRKTRNLPANQIIAEYNEHFKDNPRSSSSIKTKIYRI